jgi:hypothetical protein
VSMLIGIEQRAWSRGKYSGQRAEDKRKISGLLSVVRGPWSAAN